MLLPCNRKQHSILKGLLAVSHNDNFLLPLRFPRMKKLGNSTIFPVFFRKISENSVSFFYKTATAFLI